MFTLKEELLILLSSGVKDIPNRQPLTQNRQNQQFLDINLRSEVKDAQSGHPLASKMSRIKIFENKSVTFEYLK